MASRSDLSKIAGPDSMAAPDRRAPNVSYAAAAAAASSSNTLSPSPAARPPHNGAVSAPMFGGESGTAKKKRHRAGKKRRPRRQSFIAPDDTNPETDQDQEQDQQRPSLLETARSSANQASFYRIKSAARSNTSLESQALLDHRTHQPIRPRRQSIKESLFASRNTGQSLNHRSANYRNSPHASSFQPSSPIKSRALRSHRMSPDSDDDDDDDDQFANDRTPLISNSARDRDRERPSTGNRTGSHAGYGTRRRASPSSLASSKRSRRASHRYIASDDESFDVNNPPSVPGSPKMGPLDQVMNAEHGKSPGHRDTIINIDRDLSSEAFADSSPSPDRNESRRHTISHPAENDVCYPADVDMSVIGEEEEFQRPEDGSRTRDRRRRRRRWPDLTYLEAWSLEEKEERQQEHQRAKKISEPVLVGGRLRPKNRAWHREEEEIPYRFTYFNETFDGTIHSRTISELTQADGDISFSELFRPDPIVLSESSSDSDTEHELMPHVSSNGSGRQSRLEHTQASKARETSGSITPAQSQGQGPPLERKKRQGQKPTWWLDVLSPTEAEMKVICKTFGIHQLTAEDILMQEPREKVELFQNYYFVNYRSFEQDKDSEDYMDPVNMYVVVFREGVISFHFSMTPHPANVRRRIRQLNDYMSPTADWMSYAIIDDITDAYAPLVHQIEDEVDDIDTAILALHSPVENSDKEHKKSGKAKELEYEKQSKSANSDTRSEAGEPTSGDNGGDMLRRVGEGRKKVMTLYRLLGNKADVIKGFAKRCNEHWEVAPRSEIGLYLGDIQDHIVTMTGNLSHYENLLSRAHSNYLAQINIRMNERAEQTNDVLGKLTVLGTIVLPMNIVTGIFGCNFLVPGQDVNNLNWFWSVCGGLLGFGLVCYLIARRYFGIV